MHQFRDRKVTVSVFVLLKFLKENRKKHIQDFQEAYLIFLDKYKQTLEKMISDAEEKNIVKMTIDLVKPVSHEKDYDQIIEMLQISVESQIEITATEFQAYVKDEWDWKNNLNVSFGSYTGKTY